MITSPVERADMAVKHMAEFVIAMKHLSEKMNRKFTVTDQDYDQVSFTLDNYPFTLAWGETTRPKIGGIAWVVQFSLSIWHTTSGSRDYPPEDIDTELVTSQTIVDCVRVAFETIAKEDIRIHMENYSYKQMAEADLESW
jgi:hypothetical protein